MPDLNERQEQALQALAQNSAGLPLADLDGRVLGALERRSFVRRQGDRVRATPAGKQYLASLSGPAAAPDEAAAPPASVPEAVPQAEAAPPPAQSDAPPSPPEEAPPPRPEPPASTPTPRQAEAAVEGPSNPATATRVQRVRKAYEVVHGEESVAPGNVEYAMNVALLVADVLQEKGMGARLCGRELWAEFLRATGYHEQKEAQRIVPQALRSEKKGPEGGPRREPAREPRARKRPRRPE